MTAITETPTMTEFNAWVDDITNMLATQITFGFRIAGTPEVTIDDRMMVHIRVEAAPTFKRTACVGSLTLLNSADDNPAPHGSHSEIANARLPWDVLKRSELEPYRIAAALMASIQKAYAKRYADASKKEAAP